VHAALACIERRSRIRNAHLKAGEVRFRNALTHTIENTGDRFEGILVTLKNAPPAKK